MEQSQLARIIHQPEKLTREGTLGAKIRRRKLYSRIIMNLN